MRFVAHIQEELTAAWRHRATVRGPAAGSLQPAGTSRVGIPDHEAKR